MNVTVPGSGSHSYRLEEDPYYRRDRTYGPGYPFASPEHERAEKHRIEREVAEAIRRALTEAEKIAMAIDHGHD